jgi:hypothetical protein
MKQEFSVSGTKRHCTHSHFVLRSGLECIFASHRWVITMDVQTDSVNSWGFSESNWWWKSQDFPVQSSLTRIWKKGRHLGAHHITHLQQGYTTMVKTLKESHEKDLEKLVVDQTVCVRQKKDNKRYRQHSEAYCTVHGRSYTSPVCGQSSCFRWWQGNPASASEKNKSFLRKKEKYVCIFFFSLRRVSVNILYHRLSSR